MHLYANAVLVMSPKKYLLMHLQGSCTNFLLSETAENDFHRRGLGIMFFKIKIKNMLRLQPLLRRLASYVHILEGTDAESPVRQVHVTIFICIF